MGADYSFYVKTIETHTRAILTPNILAIGRASSFRPHSPIIFTSTSILSGVSLERAVQGHELISKTKNVKVYMYVVCMHIRVCDPTLIQ